MDQYAAAGANTTPTPNEGVKSLQFLGDGSDDFNLSQKEVELVKLRTKVNAIAKAIDEITNTATTLMLKSSGFLRLTQGNLQNKQAPCELAF